MIKNPPIIKKIAREMGGRIKDILPDRGFFYIIFGKKKILITRKFRISRSLTADFEEIARFKDMSHELLRQNNIPVPKTNSFYEGTPVSEIKNKLDGLEFPIIIKDAAGSNSQGIFTDIYNSNEALEIIRKNIKKYKRLVAQEIIKGKEYRVLMLNKKAIGVLELIPPYVIGDGSCTVKKLILNKQKKIERKIEIDKTLKRTLNNQNVVLNRIPPKGKIIYIKSHSSLAFGGETRDVTDCISKDIVKICHKASKIMGRYLAGIDLICEDISASFKKQRFAILEINGKPDVYIHYNPAYGKTRNVVRDIIKFILKMKN